MKPARGRKKEIKSELEKIRNVLFFDWDPFGVSEAINTNDEYDASLARIVALLRKKPSVEQITRLLEDLEEGYDVEGDVKQRKTAALKLKGLSAKV